jgi:tetratricopeptide (TPR) repeat protein
MDLGILTLPLTMAALAFGFAVITDTQAVHVDRINIPTEIASTAGYTPDVVRNRLVDEMHEIEKQADSTAQARGIQLQGEKGPLVVLADYLKVTPLIRVAQETVGLIPYSFSGEVVAYGKDLEFVLRGTDASKNQTYIQVRAPKEQIKQLIHNTAYEAIRAIDPYLLAAYQFKKDFVTRDFTSTIEIIHRELAKPDSEVSKWMYNLWGIVLYQQADRAGAIEKFQAALARDPNFAAPLLNWGVVLAREGNNEEAIEKFQKLVTNPKIEASKVAIAGAYSEWGFSLALLGHYDDAFAKFDLAIKADPTFADAYSSWAEVLSALGRTDDAAKMTARSLKIRNDVIYTENLIGPVQRLPATASVIN